MKNRDEGVVIGLKSFDQQRDEIDKFSLVFMGEKEEGNKEENDMCLSMPWYKVVYKASVEDVVRLQGTDLYLYILFQKMLAQMFFWMCLVSLFVLLPNYYKKDNSDQFVEVSKQNRTDIDFSIWTSRVSSFSMLNLEKEGADTANFWIAFLVVHVNSLVCAFFLRKFLQVSQLHDKRNYSHEKMRSEHTVMVRGLPAHINLDQQGRIDMDKVRANRK